MTRVWREFGWASLVALACVVLCEVNGRTGLYLFDTGINYHYGWLIYQGQAPFVEIETPLAPLSGILTAAGYAACGVTYLSSVHLASLLSGIGALVIGLSLAPVLSRPAAGVFAFALVSTTLPVIGTLYYNHLGYLLVVAWHTAVLCMIGASADRRWTVWSVTAWSLTALIALNKVHLGVLHSAVLLAVELVMIRDGAACVLRSAVKGLALRIAPLLVGAGAVLVWADWDIAAILRNLSVPDRPSLHPEAIAERFFGLPSDILAMPVIGPGTCFLVGGALLLDLIRAAPESRQLRYFAVLFLGSSVVQAVGFITSGEAPSGTLPGALCLLLIAAVAARRVGAPGPTARSISPLIGLAASAGVFAVSYGWEGLRKAWDEDGTWLQAPIANDHEVTSGFFRGVHVRAEQQLAIERVEAIVAAAGDARVFFAPELEMFYPATGRLGPKPWLLWSHPGVSVSVLQFRELRERFNHAEVDIVFKAPTREGLSPYLTKALETDYSAVEMREPCFVVVLFRHGFVPSASLVEAVGMFQ